MQEMVFWAESSPYCFINEPFISTLLVKHSVSRPRGALKGKDGATNDSRRAPMGPVGVLSVTAGLLGI